MRRLIEEKIRGFPLNRKRQFVCSILAPFLWMMSLGVKGVIKAKNTVYDIGLLSSQKVQVPVISIGNIVAGGTGKTPFVITLFERLNEERVQPIAILLRGYKGEIEKTSQCLVVCNKRGPLCSQAACGDEAYLLATRLPQAIIIAGKDRLQGAYLAINLGAKVLILDDGMQYRRLYRDFELVSIQGNEWDKKAFFLPKGLLRDEVKRLKKADYLFTKSCMATIPMNYPPCIKLGMTSLEVLHLQTEEKLYIEGRTVGVFCGIGNPLQFIETLKSLKVEIVESLFLMDHEKISEKKLQAFAIQAKKEGATLLICTEKDKVKLDLKEEPHLPIAWIKSTACVTHHKEAFEDLIKKIKSSI